MLTIYFHFRELSDRISELQDKLDQAQKARDEFKDKFDTERSKHTTIAFSQVDGNLPQIPSMELDINQMKQQLRWTQDKLRRVQAELSDKHLSSLKPLQCPDRVVGPISLKKKKEENVEDQLQNYIKESDHLSLEYSRLISVDEKERNKLYKRDVFHYNCRVNDVSLA